jgi:hypothetical protein
MKPAPVLCLGFNRPDLFARVLAEISRAGPREVFVSVDGPRPGRPDESAQRERVVRIARAIDWAENVHFNVLEANLGCGRAVSSAISWALGQVEELIIFEDDCLPHPSFLRMCDELLERYRDDERVMQISATNWGASQRGFAGYSYAFCSFAPVWGWATWRRAWELNDYTLDSWPRLKATGLVKGMSIDPKFRRLLERDWERVLAGGGTWDHQWQYSVLRNHGLSVIPARNLVVNIGFRADGTQLQGEDRFFSNLPLEALEFPLRHPDEAIRNPTVEAVFARVYWQKLGWPGRLFRWLVRDPRINRVIRTAVRRALPRPS